MRRFVRLGSSLVASLLVCAAILSISGLTRAALEKPTYAAANRWVYVLDGSLRGFPGVNASLIRNIQFGLVGRVEVAVVGPENTSRGGEFVSTVRVDTSASGFLNGTFSVLGGGTAHVTGTFTTFASELWEDQAYLPVESRGTSTYLADVTYFITTQLEAELSLNATTSVATIPPFTLDIGQNATADLATHLDVNSTFTVFGQTTSSSNQTDVSSTWRREVLSLENVTVEAGTFSAYKLNQTLGSFPGIPGGFASGNETAYFSNDVGFYVKRVAYVNGTPFAEMTLKSYSYGSAPSGLSATDILLFVALPIAVALLVLVALWRRRNVRVRARRSPPGPSAPPGQEPGAEKRAR